MLANYSFVTIITEQNIAINPYDMDVILTTIMSHPAVKKTGTSLPMCLPGVCDDGYVYLMIKYITPNIGIIYVSLGQEQFMKCLEKANDVALTMEKENLTAEVTQHITENFFRMHPIVPNGNSLHCYTEIVEVGNDVTMVVIKQLQTGQITTFNMPFMFTKKEEKLALRLIEMMFRRAIEPREGEWTEPFEHLQREDKDVAYVSADERYMLIVLATCALSNKDIADAVAKLRENLLADEEQFFINSYS